MFGRFLAKNGGVCMGSRVLQKANPAETPRRLQEMGEFARCLDANPRLLRTETGTHANLCVPCVGLCRKQGGLHGPMQTPRFLALVLARNRALCMARCKPLLFLRKSMQGMGRFARSQPACSFGRQEQRQAGAMGAWAGRSTLGSSSLSVHAADRTGAWAGRSTLESSHLDSGISAGRLWHGGRGIWCCRGWMRRSVLPPSRRRWAIISAKAGGPCAAGDGRSGPSGQPQARKRPGSPARLPGWQKEDGMQRVARPGPGGAITWRARKEAGGPSVRPSGFHPARLPAGHRHKRSGGWFARQARRARCRWFPLAGARRSRVPASPVRSGAPPGTPGAPRAAGGCNRLRPTRSRSPRRAPRWRRTSR